MEDQFESDKELLLPPQYSETDTGGLQMPGTQTIIHVKNSVPPPPDYFAFSLFVTICCCLPFGIVALVKSSEVRTLSAMGDLQGAERSSSQAKKWSFASLFTGIGITAFTVLLYVVAISVAASHANY